MHSNQQRKSDNPIKELRYSYDSKGYCIVDDFLPYEVAEDLNRLFKNEKKWEHHDQIRDAHYQHVFSTSSPSLPRANESYIAKFGRAKNMEKSSEFRAIYDDSIKPTICNLLNVVLTTFDTRCYRLLPGDLYRTHIDDYAGNVGLIYYLNKRWVWDWGGILHLCNDTKETDISVHSILPKFNRAILINHKVFRLPHFISTVETFAQEPRYALVSFNK